MESIRHWLRWRPVNTLLALGAIIALGAWLRLYGTTANGFRMCDEGYYFVPARLMAIVNHAEPVLYFYHGTIVWVYWGCRLFGFSPESALLWAALNGIACLPLIWLFSRLLFSSRIALLAALAAATNYFLVYYSRINLSNIYGLVFTLAAMCLLARLVPMLDPGRPDAWSTSDRHLRIALTAAIGVIGGLLFHIRIDACIFLCGMVGAIIPAMALRTSRHQWLGIVVALLPSFLILILSAILAYALFAAAYFPWFDWPTTREWYLRQLPFLTGTARPWRLYFLEHLWHLTSIPFWTVAAIGVIAECTRFRRLPFPRFWLLICVLGTLVGFLLLGIPFPRGHLFAVLLLAFYWAAGLVFLAGAGPRPLMAAMAASLAVLTVGAELWMIQPMFRKRAGYDQVAQIIQQQPADILSNPNWPVLKAYLPYQAHAMLNQELPPPGGEAELRQLLQLAPTRGCRYLVLDYYTAPFVNPEPWERLAAACPPAAIFANDYGEDYHNLMDALGWIPPRNLFSNKIMLFDLMALPNPLPSFPLLPSVEKLEQKLTKSTKNL